MSKLHTDCSSCMCFISIEFKWGQHSSGVVLVFFYGQSYNKISLTQQNKILKIISFYQFWDYSVRKLLVITCVTGQTQPLLLPSVFQSVSGKLRIFIILSSIIPLLIAPDNVHIDRNLLMLFANSWQTFFSSLHALGGIAFSIICFLYIMLVHIKLLPYDLYFHFRLSYAEDIF